MNFEQAREYSFLVKWKVAECFSGPECWCRIVVPVEPIYYAHPESDKQYEYAIVDAGALDERTAEHIVRLHNENYENIKQSCRDVMKETIDSMVPLNEKEMVETFEKLWANKHSKVGKIVRKEID